MKALKVILIVLGTLLAIFLVVPLFTPSVATISSNIHIELTPEQVFSSVASFSNREAWDPWLEMDSTAVPKIQPVPGYVGSTYEWEGKRLGTGKMVVDSVVENEFIQSSIWFGDMPNPSTIQWTFKNMGGQTHATWTFIEETSYPLGRWRMIIGKPILKKSLDHGLENLKAYLEANPPVITGIGEIVIDTFSPVNTMVVQGPGNMNNVSVLMDEFYGKVMSEIQKQGLQVAGPPFALYTDWNDETGDFVLTAGLPVATPGKKSGDVFPRFFDEWDLVVGKHTGAYEKFGDSYAKLMKYIEDNNIETEDIAIEIYLVGPMQEPDPNKYETLIAFPVK